MIKAKFSDLDDYSGYYKYIGYTSISNSYIKGTSSKKYSPTKYLTRAAAITILYRMAGSPYKNGNNPYSKNPFSDVKKTDYYYNAACWALKNGITSSTTFNGTGYCTRQALVTFLFRYANKKGYVDSGYKSQKLTKYSDDDSVASFATKAMKWAVYEGLISGTSLKKVPVDSGIDYPYVANTEIHVMENYESGLGNDLVYYTIGNSSAKNVLFLNFAIHGHEDKYAGDGYALVEEAFATLKALAKKYSKIVSKGWYIVIVPTINPDGVLRDDGCTGNCNTIGRHNAVQMVKSNGKWVKYKSTSAGKNALGHIDMNRCFPYTASGSFSAWTSTRYYTGPKAMMAQEAYAMNVLLKKYKSKSGKKYFIDVHGWTNQIILEYGVSVTSSPIGKALYNNGFNFGKYKTTYSFGGTGGRGYLARYAYALGYTACLFEFPSGSNPKKLTTSTYGKNFISAVKDMIGV